MSHVLSLRRRGRTVARGPVLKHCCCLFGFGVPEVSSATLLLHGAERGFWAATLHVRWERVRITAVSSIVCHVRVACSCSRQRAQCLESEGREGDDPIRVVGVGRERSRYFVNVRFIRVLRRPSFRVGRCLRVSRSRRNSLLDLFDERQE